MKIKNSIPIHIKAILKRMGIVLVFMFLTRIVFYLANKDSFSHVEIFDFITGIWFDCITICIYFIPIYAVAGALLVLLLSEFLRLGILYFYVRNSIKTTT